MTRLLLVATTLVVVLAVAGVGAGAEWHVHPGESIQDAIGDAGKYCENMDVNKQLTLGSDGTDDVNVTLEGHFGGATYAFAVYSSYAYIGQGQDFAVLDISDPAASTEVGRVRTEGIVQDIAISGDYAYVADGRNGFVIINISDPSSPALIGEYDTGDSCGIAVSKDCAYVISNSGLLIVNIGDPSSPALVGQYEAEDS